LGEEELGEVEELEESRDLRRKSEASS